MTEKKEFDFENWFSMLTYNGNINDSFKSSMLELAGHSDLEKSCYANSLTLLVNNEESKFIQKDENDKYFIETTLFRNDNDVTTGFSVYPFYGESNSSSQVKLAIVINNKILPMNSLMKIVNASAMYTEIKIRFTFIKDTFSFRFRYLSYVLSPKSRAKLLKKSFTQDGVAYYDGTAKISY